MSAWVLSRLGLTLPLILQVQYKPGPKLATQEYQSGQFSPNALDLSCLIVKSMQCEAHITILNRLLIFFLQKQWLWSNTKVNLRVPDAYRAIRVHFLLSTGWKYSSRNDYKKVKEIETYHPMRQSILLAHSIIKPCLVATRNEIISFQIPMAFEAIRWWFKMNSFRSILIC